MGPAGTRIEVEMRYNNTASNPSNPDPDDEVGFGLDTTIDEMAFGWMYYSLEEDGATGSD